MADEEGKQAKQDLTGQEALKKWSQLLAQVWADEKLKQRLIDNPATVLQEHGLEVRTGMELRVVENTDKVFYLTLPPKPAGDVAELTPSQLAGVAAGWCIGCYCQSGDTKTTPDETISFVYGAVEWKY